MKLTTLLLSLSTLLAIFSSGSAAADEIMTAQSEGGFLRGNRHDQMGSSYYDNLKFCGEIYDKSENDKYFWLTLLKEKDDGPDVKGGCLLKVPSNTAKDTVVCCTATNPDGGSSVQYSTDYSLAVADPKTISNTTETADEYASCGKNGGTYCPNYNYDNNQQGFAYFKIKEQNGDGHLRKMSKFVGGGHSSCGLTHKAGTCHSGAKDVYEHIHIGTGYCLEGAITLSYYCNEHNGYTCLDVDCYGRERN